MSIADQLKDKIVNPKDLTSYDSFETKAIISKREQVLLSITRARQKCGWNEKLQKWVFFRDVFIESLLLFSRSVGGQALLYQKEGTVSRVQSEDRQTQKFEEKK